jgi:hypothetical protein
MSYISSPNVTKLLGVRNAETPSVSQSVSQQAGKYDLQ